MNNVVDSSVKTVISTGKMEDFFTMLHEYDSIRTSDCLIKNQKSVDIHITRNKGRIGNWVMTENELDSIDQLVPAVYTGFRNSNYSSWVVTDVFVLTYPQHPTESVIQVKQGNLRFALYFSQEGGLLHERDITNGDDTNWPVME